MEGFGNILNVQALQRMTKEDAANLRRTNPEAFWDLATSDEHKKRVARPTFPSLSEITAQAQPRVRDIFGNWYRLNTLLRGHEAVIRNRWTKKTTTKRKDLLRQVWPEIPSTHRPDFQVLQDETNGKGKRVAGNDLRKRFLFPMINLQDLSEARSLLLLLNSRGHHLPEEFVQLDLDATHIGIQTKVIPVAMNFTAIMTLIDEFTGHSYGKIIIEEGEGSEGQIKMQNGKGLLIGEGLLVLEIQDELLHLLVRCVELILHDLPLDDASIPEASALPSRTASDAGNEHYSLSTATFEAPYNVPKLFDFLRLQCVISAKSTEAIDHVWMLREDPSYFTDIAREQSDHRPERVLRTKSEPTPDTSGYEFWDRTFSGMVRDAYMTVLIWESMAKKLAELAKLRDEYQENLDLDGSLPDKYEDVICQLEYQLRAAERKSQIELQNHVEASPLLRMHFVRNRVKDDRGVDVGFVVRRKSNEKDDLLWLLNQCCSASGPYLSALLDELERVTSKDRKQAKRLSADVSGILSDLAFMIELFRQLALSRPGIPGRNRLEGTALEEKFKADAAVAMGVGELANDLRLSNLGIPLSQFAYPAGKPRTEAYDKGHAESRTSSRYQTGMTLHDYVGGAVGQHILFRTLDWVDPSPQSEDAIPAEAKDHLPSLISSIALEPSSSKVAQEPPKKSKVKTRGVRAETTSENVQIEADTEDTHSQLEILVSKKAMRVFATLLRATNEDGVSSEIPWSSFVHAMSSAGFSAKKQDGSAWVFAPIDNAAKRSIVIHEPHPDSKISFQIARRIGRRLTRAFGWGPETFVEKTTTV